MSNEELVTVVVSGLCLLGAWRLLTSPQRAVRWARWFTVATAAGSLAAIAAGWLLARPWALEAVSRGILLATVLGICLAGLVLLRARLRPRGFAATTRRYASYKRVLK